MSVDAKHIATFLLGAAAALGAKKLMDMTPEDKEKLTAQIKDKAHQLKTEAEGLSEKAAGYFEELKTKGTAALKEHFPEAEDMLHKLFGNTATSTKQETTEPKA